MGEDAVRSIMGGWEAAVRTAVSTPPSPPAWPSPEADAYVRAPPFNFDRFAGLVDAITTHATELRAEWEAKIIGGLRRALDNPMLLVDDESSDSRAARRASRVVGVLATLNDVDDVSRRLVEVIAVI